jgi:acetyl esterase/lipase
VPAAAQVSGMPADIEAKVSALGAVIIPPETAKRYAPLQEKDPYEAVKVTRNLKYGPDERHALDLFVSEAPATTPRPVLAFVHGGAFIGGNRRAATATKASTCRIEMRDSAIDYQAYLISCAELIAC